MYDIIIDIVVNGRALLPEEIPQSVSDHIMAAQGGLENEFENGDASGEIEYGGVRYEWSIRPCVYP